MRVELYHKYPSSQGGGIMAFHVWSRLAATWFKAGVIYDDPNWGVCALNGKLAEDGAFIPYAPEFQTLYDLRKNSK